MALRNQEIAERLRDLRGDRPQTLVATEIGVSPRALQSWELADARPSWRNVERLAAFYGVAEEFILTGGRRSLSRSAGGHDGEETPEALPVALEDRVTRMEERLDRHAQRVEALLAEQTELLGIIRGLVERLTPLIPGIEELLDPDEDDPPPAS